MRVEIKIVSGADDFSGLRAENLFSLNGHDTLLDCAGRGGGHSSAADEPGGVAGAPGGGLAYHLDGRHRRVAIKNLTASFAENSEAETKAIAKENFCRIGENYITSIKSSAMSFEKAAAALTLTGGEQVVRPGPGRRPGTW